MMRDVEEARARLETCLRERGPGEMIVRCDDVRTVLSALTPQVGLDREKLCEMLRTEILKGVPVGDFNAPYCGEATAEAASRQLTDAIIAMLGTTPGSPVDDLT